MTGPPLIDRAVLDDLFDSIGPDGARSVLELFVGESRAYLATIAEAVAAGGDPARRDRARRAAHSLKSGAGQIGAAALAAAAAEVERVAAADIGADLAQAAVTLERCAAETVNALARHLPKQ
jgi:HPt (histidine-containing phosphotransfer) domain-containing protein